jgi:photosystem II stability/assembly factor-like uncharacterized protein
MTALLRAIYRLLIWVSLVCLVVLNFNSCGTNSDSSGTGPNASVPPPPVIRLVPVSMKWINIVWNESQKAAVTGFIIQRASATDTIYRTIANVGASVNYYSDSTLTPDQYSYRVHAYNDNGNSRMSNVATLNLLSVVFPVSRLSSAIVSLGSVRLQWTINSANATGFRIERRMSDDTVGTIIDSVGSGITVYIDTKAPCGAFLTYRVQAFSSLANANFSAPTNVTMPFSTQSVLTSGIRSAFYSIGLFDDQNAITVGSGGTIARTTNGGLSWTKIKTTASGNFFAISCIKPSTAYAVGDKGKILKSIDAGLTWVSLSPGITSAFYGTFFMDQQTGFVVGQDGMFIKTTDGGATWKLVASGAADNLYSIVFSSSLIGYAVGAGGTILKSTDGGLSWFSQNTPASWTLRSVGFSSDSTGYAIGAAGVILHTDNGGNTWTAQQSNTGNSLRSIAVFGQDRAIIVGERSTLLYTVTGGKTWIRIQMQGSHILAGINYLPGSIGYFVGSSGIVYQIQTCF